MKVGYSQAPIQPLDIQYTLVSKVFEGDSNSVRVNQSLKYAKGSEGDKKGVRISGSLLYVSLDCLIKLQTLQ